ncbi:MAG: DNA-processing protein DprA [Burkholderiaceae bacterium]
MTSLRNPDLATLPPPGRDELAAWLRLSLTDGVGAATAVMLLSVFGSPERVLGASHRAVSEVVGAAIATRLVRLDPEVDARVESSLAWADHPDQHILTLGEPHYPRSLLDIPDPPVLLFVRGDVNCLNQPMLAIVGSRHASRGGLENAQAFAHELAARGICIASGLALGIDGAAHQGAIAANGLTVGVLGTGLANIYPARHRALADKVCLNGALVSEFDLASGPRRGHFPRRNRIIAGLSAGVLVIEAASQSGSLITARLAGEYGRDVFAVPGSIHSPHSKGCHRLIRDGARLVESTEDVLSECRPDFLSAANACRELISPSASAIRVVKQSESNLDKDSRAVLKSMGWDSVSYDSLSSKVNLDNSQLDHTLLQLELDGWLERSPDGRLTRLSGPA